MITLTQTSDMNLVKLIVTSPEIWDYSVEDGVKKDCYIPTYDDYSLWLLCEIDNEIAGAVYVCNANTNTLIMHPNILKKYRKHCRDVIYVFLKWFLDLPKFICKLNVAIPSCRRIVYNLAKKIGFIDEGINRNSFCKNGIMHDQYLLGLTRLEVEGLL